jgi:acetyltransferase-like isoleucine patch superfamily enzyme
MIIFTYIYKIINKLLRFLKKSGWIVVFLKLKLNNVKFNLDFKSHGIPIVHVALKAKKFIIGRNFEMNNGLHNNMIGRQQPCFFIVEKHGELIIGDNVGISATAIVCTQQIIIKNNVRIGGGTVIYDTDFHSLNSQERIAKPEIRENIKTAPVLIKENVFIGANCTILKGVTIGANSIVGACSVVTRNIPDNEIWGGNPARFIKKIIDEYRT